MRIYGVLAALVISTSVARAATTPTLERPTLLRVDKKGGRTELPLVKGHVSCAVRGPIAQITLVQRFANPDAEPIEAIYVFPMPHDAAVGGMTMRIGTRTVRAVIKRRDEARAVYDKAKREGKAAALLEQERPNVFTQSVANILPKEEIEIELTYDVLLEPDSGEYELALPTVVGPRYLNDRVPDPHRISPPVAAPGKSTDNMLGFDLDVDAGLPITEVTSPTHAIVASPTPGGGMRVALAAGAMLANKDLVVRWKVIVTSPALAVLADKTGDRGHVALIVQPPVAPPAGTGPRELVFVVDTSGSMDGEPLAVVKRAMRHALADLDPGDTFRILNFSSSVSGFQNGDVVAATPKAVRDAQSWVNGLVSAGGTEMIHGITAALPGPTADGRTRYVVFMTDGYIGNEADILRAIKKRLDRKTHLFSFGIGSAVNRYLLDEMAKTGRGLASYMLLDEDPVIQIDRFFDRVSQPIAEDLRIQWDGVAVETVTPAAIGPLFAGKPIVIAARYSRPGTGTIRVSGTQQGVPLRLTIPVNLPAGTGDGAVLGRLWARRRILELSAGGGTDEKAITDLGLTYALMTPYTSFVAVETRPRTDKAGKTVRVPVELPEGVTPRAVGGYVTTTHGGEVIAITGRAPMIDTGSTALGVTFSGASSLENAYYAESSLPGVAGEPLDMWRLSLSATLGYDLRGERLLTGVSPSLERRLGRSAFAAGLTGSVWRLDDRAIASALGTIARWSILRLFDARFGIGMAFAPGGSGPAWQLRLAAPLPLGRALRPELGLHVEGATPGDEDLLGVTIGIGARF